MKKLIFLLITLFSHTIGSAQNTPSETDTCDIVYTVVEEMPKFKEADFLKYLSKQMHIPHGFKNTETVWAEFIVNKEGKATNVKIVRAAPTCTECDKMVVDVLNSLPKWKPGKQDGRPVCVRYTVPVRFSGPK